MLETPLDPLVHEGQNVQPLLLHFAAKKETHHSIDVVSNPVSAMKSRMCKPFRSILLQQLITHCQGRHSLMPVSTNRPYVDQWQQTDCGEPSLHRAFGLWLPQSKNQKANTTTLCTAQPSTCLLVAAIKCSQRYLLLCTSFKGVIEYLQPLTATQSLFRRLCKAASTFTCTERMQQADM